LRSRAALLAAPADADHATLFSIAIVVPNGFDNAWTRAVFCAMAAHL
jgi:hypothetical protein